MIGIEPNDEMRGRAEAAGAPHGPAPVYRAGRAEATGLPDGAAAAVLSAQAFHWFDVGPTLREFHRILRPAGHAVLMWNERDDADPCTAAYTAVVRTAPENAALEGSRGRAGEPLLTSLLFEDASRTLFRNLQELDEEGVLGRTFSASWARASRTPRKRSPRRCGGSLPNGRGRAAWSSATKPRSTSPAGAPQ